MIASSPRGRSGYLYQRWQQSLAGDPSFFRILVSHWWDNDCRKPLTEDEAFEVYQTIDEEERHLLRVNGITDPLECLERVAWRRAKKRALGVLFAQEYPEDEATCWLSGGDLFFDVQAIADQREAAKPILSEAAGGAVRQYVAPVPGRDYIIGTDTSEGVATGDACSIQVIDAETNEQVAELYGIFTPHRLAELTIKHLCNPYNEALWAIERNNHGHAVIEAATHSFAYSHLYRHKQVDRRTNQVSRRYGWLTDAQTRPLMLDSLYEALIQNAVHLNSEVLFNQLLDFRYTGDRAEGAADHAIFALAIAHQVRKQGRRVDSLAPISIF